MLPGSPLRASLVRPTVTPNTDYGHPRNERVEMPRQGTASAACFD